MSVLIVIPCRDEARNLPEVVAELRQVRPADEIVVVDDASQDDSAQVARDCGCEVLRLPMHLGYGGAVQSGVKLGLRRGVSAVVTFDGDGQHDPRDIQPLLEALGQGADLALGSRFQAEGAYRGGPLRIAGRVVFAWLCRMLTGLALDDPTSGLKALGPRAQALFASTRFPDRFPDADALVVAHRGGLALAQRPARMRASRNRHSMHDGLKPFVYACNMVLSLLVAALGKEDDLRE